eukprot:CAMPEP_0174252828 /NCGR_PEP_ID=MMETSP0439-20130205/2190_1 /TAXON_ID=0 /ORGANISM="Stereomyxa ramosa, Strain Chinc5" /LENGTH=402 /DNA_ID=CAMNT_0015333473 /DNA_START=27 /DNA_END=1235 /DNA_ORIENTATION=+
MEKEREFDVVIWGATGFTGGLVVKYLATKSQKEPFRWAVAGRNKSKLEDVRKKFSVGEDVGTIIADSGDLDSLDAMVTRTKVIASTVGPFMKYGSSLVASCAKNGTHYCDITGEAIWVREMIDKYDEEARKNGAYIVSMCGYDSIPSDLGALFVRNYIRDELKSKCLKVKTFIATNGSASGGTISTMLDMLENTPKKDIAKSQNTHYLDPDYPNVKIKPDAFEKDIKSVSYDKDLKKWTAPFVMAAVNTRVVRRSSRLCNYGDNFRYNEMFQGGFISCFTLWIGLAIFLILMIIPFTRFFVKKFLPSPGEGPSEKKMEKSFFKHTIVAEASNGEKVWAEVRGGDPGYAETSKMLSESALCLAFDSPNFERDGGCLTPAASMGTFLIERLNENGLTFSILDKK